MTQQNALEPHSLTPRGLRGANLSSYCTLTQLAGKSKKD